MLRPARAALALVPVLLWLAAPAQATTALSWPLEGEPEVGRLFQPPATAWGAGHRGADLLASPGAAVLAAADGRITYAGLLAGRGVVTVTHEGGLRTTYEPVDALVSVGAEVARGEVIGLLATGHASCPPDRACLHWGLLRGTTYLDPLAVVARGRARLLPTTPQDRAAAADVQDLQAGSGRHPAAGTPSTGLTGTRSRVAARDATTGSGAHARRTLAAGLVLAGAGALAAARLRF